MTDATAAMVERLLGVDKVTTSAGARWCGDVQGGPPLHPSTLVRRALRGVRGPDGQRVYLDHMRLGGKFVTSRQALARFIAAQTRTHHTDGPAPRTPAERRRAVGQAEAELERLGV